MPPPSPPPPGHIDDLAHLAPHPHPTSAPVSAAAAAGAPADRAVAAGTGAAGAPPRVERVSLTRISGKSSLGSPTGPPGGALRSGQGEAPALGGFPPSAVTSAAGSPVHPMGEGYAAGGTGTPGGGRTPTTVPGTPVHGAGGQGHTRHHSQQQEGWAGAGITPAAAASVAAATAAAAAGTAAAANASLASAFAGATANATVAAGPGSNTGGPVITGTATPARPSMPGNMSMSTSGALSVGGAAPANVGTSTAFGMRHRASHSRNASFQDFHLGSVASYASTNPADGPGSYNPAAAGVAAARDSNTGGPAAIAVAPGGAAPHIPSRLSNASAAPAATSAQASAAAYSKVEGKAQ
jgi:hypothetical protein